MSPCEGSGCIDEHQFEIWCNRRELQSEICFSIQLISVCLVFVQFYRDYIDTHRQVVGNFSSFLMFRSYAPISF